MNPPSPLRRAIGASVLLAAAMPVAQALRPTRRTAQAREPIELDTQVPLAFGSWRAVPGAAPVLPDPQLQGALERAYGQVIARNYVDAAGGLAMLSIAYGDDQSGESTAAHRPEFCYRAQGFAIDDLGDSTLDLPDRRLPLRRLFGRRDNRSEPISYWLTLDERASLPGVSRKFVQLAYGLRGLIPDGMLVRVSSLGPPTAAAFALHARFVAALFAALPAPLRARYFGAADSKGAR